MWKSPWVSAESTERFQTCCFDSCSSKVYGEDSVLSPVGCRCGRSHWTLCSLDTKLEEVLQLHVRSLQAILISLWYTYKGFSCFVVVVFCFVFSSAFNTIQLHPLIKIYIIFFLLDLDTDHSLVIWIRQFICCRLKSQPAWNIV